MYKVTPIKITVPSTLVELDAKIHNSVCDLIVTVKNQQEAILENALRENAIPPIKGDITEGKIKWRGITLVMEGDRYTYHQMYLTQRGKRISPIIKTSYVTQH